jgi:hypothetical protein
MASIFGPRSDGTARRRIATLLAWGGFNYACVYHSSVVEISGHEYLHYPLEYFRFNLTHSQSKGQRPGPSQPGSERGTSAGPGYMPNIEKRQRRVISAANVPPLQGLSQFGTGNPGLRSYSLLPGLA